MDEDALREIKGIGPKKAKQIMAVLALHQAWSTSKPLKEVIRKSADAYQGSTNVPIAIVQPSMPTHSAMTKACLELVRFRGVRRL